MKIQLSWGMTGIVFPLALGLLLCPAFSPATALAGQTIAINSDPGAEVYGNGDLPDGALPAAGVSGLKDPNRNTVIVNSDVNGSVVGGLALNIPGAATASGNTVTVSGGVVDGDVYSGEALSSSGNATASGNTVTVSGGVVDGNVYSGEALSSSGNATASGNTVTISGGTVNVHVYSGKTLSNSGNATASGNSVTISGGAMDDNVYSGEARSVSSAATASGNTVTISGGAVNGNVYSGETLSISGNATASGNTVIISGGAVEEDVYSGEARSESGAATAFGNTVTISGGTVEGDVSGGSVISIFGAATASGNSVIISGDAVNGSVYGGSATSSTGNATASGNTVTVSGGTVNTDVIGGFAYSDSGAATASGNTVTVSGGTVNTDVIGGFAYSASGAATASGNTVTVSGSPTFSGTNTYLYGGLAGAGQSDAFTGNTLNVWNYSGSEVDNVLNFEFFNFAFPVTQSGPVLTVTNQASLSETTTPDRSSTVTAGTLGGAAPLPPGASVTLIRAGTLTAAGFTQTRARGLHGATLSYLWDLNTIASDLTATVRNVRAAPGAKALSEGFISGMALVNQGVDLVAGQGMEQAVNAAGQGIQGGVQAGHGFGAFGALSGGRSRYDTGSHVDMASVSLLTGLSWGADLTPGRLTLGAFFEYGNGSYDTYNSFSNAASVHGDGDMYHTGGGILGRLDFVPAGILGGPGRFYAEASGRAGRVHNEYNSSDLRDAAGR
ncbi:MAG: hypothetical protein LBM64_07590, partial [Deltaproteobacteria bacterium]|nr:hypothetical protein [Deltaproteobacteria bacterium]